jgi:hypothetical protein
MKKIYITLLAIAAIGASQVVLAVACCTTVDANTLHKQRYSACGTIIATDPTRQTCFTDLKEKYGHDYTD